MIYLVLAVLFLHIISAPIVVGLFASICSEQRKVKISAALFAVTVFNKAVSFDTIERKLVGGELQSDVGKASDEAVKTEKSLKIGAFAIRFAKNILLRITVRNIGLSGTVGFSDAAVTAVVCSMSNIFYTQACAFFRLPCAGGISANGNKTVKAEADCIISVTIADIIIALLCSAAKRSSHERSRGIQRASD